MVLLNYEQIITDTIIERAQKLPTQRLVQACQSKQFIQLAVKFYQYCQQINILERRMRILAKQTEKMKTIKPKLLQSQISKVEQKTKQISSSYSMFLMKQGKFKVASDQAKYFQKIIKFLQSVMQKCFTEQESFKALKKQINRLFRTNSFNWHICWQQFLQQDPQQQQPKQQLKKPVSRYSYLSTKKNSVRHRQSNFKSFRRTILHEGSEIRPYLNNKSSFRSNFTRSPIITLLYPTSDYMEFKLKSEQKQIRKGFKHSVS